MLVFICIYADICNSKHYCYMVAIAYTFRLAFFLPPCFYLYIINIFRISVQILRSMHLSSVLLLAYLSPTVKKKLYFGEIQSSNVHSVLSESSRRKQILEKNQIQMLVFICISANICIGKNQCHMVAFQYTFRVAFFLPIPSPILNFILSITQIITFPYSGIIF